MLDNGFNPDFPQDVLAETPSASSKVVATADGVVDLRSLPWSSIDNDSSRDLDQLEVAEQLTNGDVRVRVAIADVDGTVPRGTATDKFAAANATSVYTGVVTYPMLPERLSTNLTSLGESADRASIVIEFVVGNDGTTRSHTVYPALVRNKAKLAYGNVGAWLDGRADLPSQADKEIQDQLRLQDNVAQSLRAVRARAGALDLDTVEAQAVVHSDNTVGIESVPRTRASALIEDFMIAANVAMAQFLDENGTPSIRRIVRRPERWNRIVELAASLGTTLPAEPDPHALEAFLVARRAADPVHFPDLSLSVIKLLGPGEYALHTPGTSDEGHFALAAHDYTHSTAPNRRFADLAIQRLLKAVIAKQQPPYSDDELTTIAAHCTEREDAARKVERQVRKVAAAVSMMNRVGESFDAIVTGVMQKGVFARVIAPPIEGRIMRGQQGLDVGDKIRVTLLSTDPERGFVDFSAMPKSR
jgi:VacB/RNase II family 3'-5' exoribonuclease